MTRAQANRPFWTEAAFRPLPEENEELVARLAAELLGLPEFSRGRHRSRAPAGGLPRK